MENPVSEVRLAPPLSLQEEALVSGMLHATRSTINYKIDDQGVRIHLNPSVGQSDLALLIDRFKSSPKDCLAYSRDNLFAIGQDPRLSPQDKKNRIQRYVDAYLGLMVKLDHQAFPADGQLRRGIPNYVPDGLSDMGSDPEVDPRRRGREKIRVDKREIFDQSKQLFYDIFSLDVKNASSDAIKNYIVQRVAYFINNEMPYNREGRVHPDQADRSVKLSEMKEQMLSVCRHHALYTQVLLQAFGLTSRLLKCDVDFQDGTGWGPHVANLVRINDRWHLLDTTNPDEENGVGKVFLRPVPERDVDLNKQTYQWQFKEIRDRRTWTYRSRNNMYYAHRDNNQPL